MELRGPPTKPMVLNSTRFETICYIFLSLHNQKTGWKIGWFRWRTIFCLITKYNFNFNPQRSSKVLQFLINYLIHFYKFPKVLQSPPSSSMILHGWRPFIKFFWGQKNKNNRMKTGQFVGGPTFTKLIKLRNSEVLQPNQWF